MKLKKSAATAAVVALSALMPLGLATPADAVLASGCSASSSYPYTDNTYVYASATATCNATAGPKIIYVKVTIQEDFLGWWTRSSAEKGSAGTRSLSVSTKYYCNGHGTDTYKSTVDAKTYGGGTTFSSNGYPSLTC